MTAQDKWGQGVEREASAHHEAGHAVVSVYVGLAVESVDIIRRNGDLGGCQGIAPDKAVEEAVAALLQARELGQPVDVAKISPAARQWIDQMIRSTLAGPLAEERFRGRKLPAGDLGKIDDDSTVHSLASICWPTAERIRRVQELESEVADLLAKPAAWMAVEAIAKALVKREFLTGAEVSELYWDARAT
jgi:hypothetical protein